MNLGAPLKIFHESKGTIVTISVKTGETYRGKMYETEDNMNCQLQDVTMTAKDGSQQRLENVFIRGSQIEFIVLPEMFKNSPCLKSSELRKNTEANRVKNGKKANNSKQKNGKKPRKANK